MFCFVTYISEFEVDIYNEFANMIEINISIFTYNKFINHVFISFQCKIFYFDFDQYGLM